MMNKHKMEVCSTKIIYLKIFDASLNASNSERYITITSIAEKKSKNCGNKSEIAYLLHTECSHKPNNLTTV
jgi:hypothetical protein